MFRLGIVSELGTGENLGFARVSFDEVDMVSSWLSLPSSGTKTVKHWQPIEVNSQVSCLMDEDCEQGYVAAVLWNDDDAPPDWATEDTIGIEFADGAKFYYDAKKHELTIDAPDTEINMTCKKINIKGDVNIEGDSNLDGKLKVTGNVDTDKEIVAKGNIKAGTLGYGLTTHRHTSTSATGVTTAPTVP